MDGWDLMYGLLFVDLLFENVLFEIFKLFKVFLFYIRYWWVFCGGMGGREVRIFIML